MNFFSGQKTVTLGAALGLVGALLVAGVDLPHPTTTTTLGWTVIAFAVVLIAVRSFTTCPVPAVLAWHAAHDVTEEHFV